MDLKTLQNRVAVCYPDNKEFLDDLLKRFKSQLENYELNSNYTILDYNEEFVPFLEEQYKEKMDSATNAMRTMYYRELGDLKTVSSWLECNYFDFSMEHILCKGYDLGAEKPMELSELNKISEGKHLGDGLILPDGKFYPALGGHYLMMEWLMANGIDCKSAIRAVIYSTSMAFSDLTGYCDVDNNFKLTPAQARSMFNLYRLNKMKIPQDFQNVMLDSRYLGFTLLSNPSSGSNLTMIEEESEKISNAVKDVGREDAFSKNEYRQAVIERARDEKFLNY